MATLRTTSLPDAVYGSLRADIVTEFDPGTTVTEGMVALRYGVARPTAKAALERLVAEGLLSRQAHRAARVPELSRDDIVDVYSTRSIVEERAMEDLARTARVPAAAMSAHRELLAHLDAEDGSEDRAALAQDDISFHRALVLGQNSPRLARMHDLIMGEVELCIGQVLSRRLIDPRLVADQHQGILDAITAGDPSLARILSRHHIEGARDRLLEKYDDDHDAPRA